MDYNLLLQKTLNTLNLQQTCSTELKYYNLQCKEYSDGKS